METKYGTIEVIKKNKGYGFIKPDDAQSREDNIFFHANDVLSSSYAELKNGERVEYLEKETSKGKAAYDVAVM